MSAKDANDLRALLAGIFLLALFLIGLELGVRVRVLSPATFAGPLETLIRVPRLLVQDRYYLDLARTAWRALLSALAGFPAGVSIAIWVLCLGRFRAAGELGLDVARSVPLTALAPAFVAMSIGDGGKIALGALAAALLTAVAVWNGIRAAEVRFGPAVWLLRPKTSRLIRWVLLPAAAPSVATAMRLSMSGALVLVIVAEMAIGTDSGVGKVINDKLWTDDRSGQYAAILLAGVLGYGLNLVGVAGGKLVLLLGNRRNASDK